MESEFWNNSLEINQFNYQVIIPADTSKIIYIIDHLIEKGYFPDGLKALRIGIYRKPLIRGALPDGLERLEFIYDYSMTITLDVLPETLLVLKIGTHTILTSGSVPCNCHLYIPDIYFHQLPIGIRKISYYKYTNIDSRYFMLSMPMVFASYQYQIPKASEICKKTFPIIE
jgi:hypothetical protein